MSSPYIALLRGINVGGHNKVPMASLRKICGDLGWDSVATYIQSGNVVFSAGGVTGPQGKELKAALEQDLERALIAALNVDASVVVRSADWWSSLVSSNPVPDESAETANRVVSFVPKEEPDWTESGAVAQAAGVPGHMAERVLAEISERAQQGERVFSSGGAIWVHYPEGQARSKVTPAVIQRSVGSAVTGRNWRTILKLQEMVGAI